MTNVIQKKQISKFLIIQIKKKTILYEEYRYS